MPPAQSGVLPSAHTLAFLLLSSASSFGRLHLPPPARALSRTAVDGNNTSARVAASPATFEAMLDDQLAKVNQFVTLKELEFQVCTVCPGTLFALN